MSCCIKISDSTCTRNIPRANKIRRESKRARVSMTQCTSSLRKKKERILNPGKESMQLSISHLQSIKTILRSWAYLIDQTIGSSSVKRHMKFKSITFCNLMRKGQSKVLKTWFKLPNMLLSKSILEPNSSEGAREESKQTPKNSWR